MSPILKVSVVVPCFNHGQFLPEAIASVNRASRADIELIVVDDGSTDEYTRRQTEVLYGQGVRVIRQENKGLAAARNAGIAASSAPYVLPLDADNRVCPAYFERGVRILDADPRVGVVYGDAQYVGQRTGRWRVGPFDLARLMRANYIDACAVFRREVWEQNGGYDMRMPVQGAEDWDFWLSTVEHAWQFAYVPEILFEYRAVEGSMITRLHASGLASQLDEYLAKKHGPLYRWAWLSALDECNSVPSTLCRLSTLIRARLSAKLGRGRDAGLADPAKNI